MKWISVKDEIPDICKDVLIHEYSGIILVAYYGEDKLWADSIGDNWLNFNVTHWMPLPEPPKETP